MKYIRTFEKISKEPNDFTKYQGKYIVYKHSSEYDFGKFLGVDYQNDDFVNVTVYKRYTGDDKYSKMYTHIHMKVFNIIKTFNTIEDAEQAYNIIKDSNKYNL